MNLPAGIHTGWNLTCPWILIKRRLQHGIELMKRTWPLNLKSCRNSPLPLGPSNGSHWSPGTAPWSSLTCPSPCAPGQGAHNPKHFMYIVMNPLNNSMRWMSFLSLMLCLKSEPKEIMHPFPCSCLSEEEVDSQRGEMAWARSVARWWVYGLPSQFLFSCSYSSGLPCHRPA